MTIAQKLLIIICLTIFEVSITIWAAFQLSKGATFHQLNLFHLKYNEQFLNQVVSLERGEVISLNELRQTIDSVRQQPVDCLELVGWIDKQIMSMIGTFHAVELCMKDIRDADIALLALQDFESEKIAKEELILTLRKTSNEFFNNSSAFEEPVTQTVEFIFRLLIPSIIFISLFNISFITYLSRTISGSIRHTIELLSSGSNYQSLSQQLKAGVSGELQELLKVAKNRIESDFMNIENNEKLKQLVDEKTKSLQAANEELEQFCYRTSHDLKSPLTRSKRLCQFIQSDLDKGKIEESKTSLKMVEEQMTSLEKLVEDLMSLAKADLQESEVDKVDLNQTINDVLTRLQPFYDESRVEFRKDISGQPCIECESVRLQQILENLISNGCKYSDPEKEQSWVKVEYNKTDAAHVITVEDNGLGIPECQHEQIFSQFKRFHPDIGSGSGLGLSIVKKHIDKMTGQISFLPTGEGSKFILEIPFKGI